MNEHDDMTLDELLAKFESIDGEFVNINRVFLVTLINSHIADRNKIARLDDELNRFRSHDPSKYRPGFCE